MGEKLAVTSSRYTSQRVFSLHMKIILKNLKLFSTIGVWRWLDRTS